MVKSKNVLILLLAFLAFLNPPAYPKNRDIKYLPSDTTMESVSYTGTPIVLGQLAGGDCEGIFNGITACAVCAEWRDRCPDCCLTSSREAIRCTAQELDAYDCDPVFEFDDCEKIKCPVGENDCDNLECADGSVVFGSPYGLQRRGCPEAGDDNLAPNGGGCVLISGTALDRKWKCSSGGLPPIFEGCNPVQDSGLNKPDKYYSVTKVTHACESKCDTAPCGSCGASCSSSFCGECLPACSSKALPQCYDNCLAPEPAIDEGVCAPGSCQTAKCTSLCSPPPDCLPQTCTPGCSVSADCVPNPDYYIYTLSTEFKEYLADCVTYSNEYEMCMDRISCCKENVCSGKEPPGFEANCANGESCAQRVGCINLGHCADISDGECIERVRQAGECLIAHSGLFKEISNTTFYPFNYRSGESLTIDWQVVLENTAGVAELRGVNFYTRIKIVDPAAGKVSYQSRLNIRNMDNAFSIYSLMHVPKGKLTPGKRYEVRLYYFLPRKTECRKKSDGSGEYEQVSVSDRTVTVEQLFLNIVRVRE